MVRRDADVAIERGRLDAVIAGLLWTDVDDAAAGDGVLVTVRPGKTNQEGEMRRRPGDPDAQGRREPQRPRDPTDILLEVDDALLRQRQPQESANSRPLGGRRLIGGGKAPSSMVAWIDQQPEMTRPRRRRRGRRPRHPRWSSR